MDHLGSLSSLWDLLHGSKKGIAERGQSMHRYTRTSHYRAEYRLSRSKERPGPLTAGASALLFGGLSYAPSVAGSSAGYQPSMYSNGPPGMIHDPGFPARWICNICGKDPHPGYCDVDDMQARHVASTPCPHKCGWGKHQVPCGLFRPRFPREVEVADKGDFVKPTAWAQYRTFGR
jgi:hypothetical protein